MAHECGTVLQPLWLDRKRHAPPFDREVPRKPRPVGGQLHTGGTGILRSRERSMSGLTQSAHVVGGPLTLPDIGIRVIGKQHGSHPIRNDPCLL